VLVCGSRGWTDRTAIFDRIAELPPGTVVFQGKARGADMIAEQACAFHGLKSVGFPANWARLGRSAGVVRNLEMLDASPDLVIAFQLDGSRGTQHTIDEARRRGIPVEIHAASRP
jgi:hypothetical protein